MSFSVNTNIASLTAQNYLRVNSDFQSKTIYRVTSGLRIVSSGDDAAGLAIANGFRSDQAVLTQGIRNANDGLSTLQTIDGGMNNISQLLDRARTLATQSASGTFTGDRNVLNDEFKSVINEIDRQAQAIGLDRNGEFAKALSVFIGGGKAHPGEVNAGDISNQNGSVSVDLSRSTVDAKSLGLKGVQALGAVTDLSAAQATSVQKILANDANKVSIGNGNITTFYVAGPGFADQSKVEIQVNLNGVTDTGTLAAAINTAIQNAGNGSTSSATAFRNAGIAATVVTDNDGQHLGFNSSTTAFQVEAGDQMANALLGNTLSASNPQGVGVTTSVTGGSPASAGAVGNSVTVHIQGAGIAGANGENFRDITLSSTNTITDLQSLVNNDAALKVAGISLTTAAAGGALQFTSARGEQFSVQATGDLNNVLGLGSYQTDVHGSFDYRTISGGTGADFGAATLMANASLHFSLNGGSSAASLTGSAITGGAMDTTGLTLGLSVNGNALSVDFSKDNHGGVGESVANIAAYINRVAAENGLSNPIATTSGNSLMLKSPSMGSHASVSVTSGGAAFGFTNGASASGSGANDIALTIGTSGSTAQGTAGFDGGATFDATHNQLLITVDGGTQQTITLDVAKDVDIDHVVDDINSQLQGAVATNVGGLLTFKSNSVGSGATVAVDTTSTAAAALYLDASDAGHTAAAVAGTVTATNGSIVSQLNQAFTADTALQAAGLQASAASGSLVISSSNETFFRIGTGYGNSGGSFGPGSVAVANMSAATALGLSQTVGGLVSNAAAAAQSSAVNSGGASQSVDYDFSALLNGNDDQTVTVSANDKNGVQQSLAITLQNDGTARTGRNIDEALNTINKALQASNVPILQNIVAVKDNVEGVEKIKFLSTNPSFTVSVGANASGSTVDGLGSQGTAKTSTVSEGGSTADISTQAAAQNAVMELASAVGTLGSAQASVGKGQNNFNYAINLAQSQLTNLAAAESRIRDADLAQEAANLTKAQILLQAGTAALAQANSAPQVVLALLKG